MRQDAGGLEGAAVMVVVLGREKKEKKVEDRDERGLRSEVLEVQVESSPQSARFLCGAWSLQSILVIRKCCELGRRVGPILRS